MFGQVWVLECGHILHTDFSSLSGSVHNSYVIDAIVAETLANRPPTPPEWPPHLDSFRDDLALTELSDHNMVFIAPGYINLKPEKNLSVDGNFRLKQFNVSNDRNI
ncbi:hypothetical protein EDD18DRAFT_1098919 [Armillaria luteobubalina]|uniref:Uncharacterized protein n=1 Tax=Armillaria luteobubalina TaxID=153913 RepID=A0AA39QPV9_9AGAR|nr:hypothetical protein EDD18DRAFT_1098919 [Armillaria luteobubalina]